MNTAIQVASTFLLMAGDDEYSISNMKLQQLLFIAQACHLAMFDKPLFEEELKARPDGPVCPEVHSRYKRFGMRPIRLTFDSRKVTWPDGGNLFSKEQAALIDNIYDMYGRLSIWKLRAFIIGDDPWKEKRSEAKKTIEKERIRIFYKRRLGLK